jgi:hypothetical protein
MMELAEVEAENERRWQSLAERFPGQVPTTPAELIDFFASEYGWTLEQIADLDDRQSFAFVKAALRRRRHAVVAHAHAEDGGPKQRPQKKAEKYAESARRRGVFQIDRWSNLGLGLDGAGRILAFTPCPEQGKCVAVSKAFSLDLPGNRWRKVLQLLAESADGKTARVADLVTQLGYAKKLRPTISAEQAEFDEGLRLKAKKATKTLKNTMADLARELRCQVTAGDDRSRLFSKAGETYGAAFTVGILLEKDDGRKAFVYGRTS